MAKCELDLLQQIFLTWMGAIATGKRGPLEGETSRLRLTDEVEGKMIYETKLVASRLPQANG